MVGDHGNFLLQRKLPHPVVRSAAVKGTHPPVGTSESRVWTPVYTLVLVGIAVALGHIDLHQTPLVNGELDRAEAQLFQCVEHGLDGARHGFALALAMVVGWHVIPFPRRSEEHTSELQSLMRISYAVFCLKKKKHKKRT